MGFKEDALQVISGNPLAKVQLFYFFYDAITKSLPRYLGLYYKHTLLLSPHQVAVLLSARYFSLFFGSPFLGSVADKLNKYRTILILCLLALLTTYVLVPLVEPVDGFNCKNHIRNHSLTAINFSHPIVKHNHAFRVKIHKYKSELKTDPLGNHYHGNLMYDLYYTWPFETFEYQETDDITRNIFVTLLVITILGEFFASPGETFADVYTLQTLGSERKKFGLQIIPGLFGWIIISISFAIITNSNVNLKDDFCHIGHIINYSPYLYIVYAMTGVCILAALFFKYVHFPDADSLGKKPEKCQCNLLKALPILFKTPAYAAFAVVVVFCGVASGVKTLYIYHYVTELGGPLFMLPIVMTVHFFSSLIALVLSPMLIERYGHVNLMLANLFVNGVTFVVYSVIETPWLVFLVEPFDGFNSLSWVAIVTYVGSPPHIGAALQGLVHGLYRGLGVAIGYLAVSVLILKYGYLALFLSLGLIYFVVFGFYLGVLHYFPKKASIAEEYGVYTVLFQNDDDDDDETMQFPTEERRSKRRDYETDKLDTSFLE